MARRGRDQITVRLEDDVLEELRPLARTERGRAGGLSFYLRRLIYQDLGRPLPEQFGREAEGAWSPRLATRLEHWLESDPDQREELLEAAGLLAARLELELVEPAELARLRKSAGEADRLRKELAARPAPPPVSAVPVGDDFQQGRIHGLRQAAQMAEDLVKDYRDLGYGDEVKGLVEGLESSASACRSLIEEIERGRQQKAAEALRRTARGTRYEDPAWLTSAARQWQLALRRDPNDKKARETLQEIEILARAAGVEIPPLPPERPRRRRPSS